MMEKWKKKINEIHTNPRIFIHIDSNQPNSIFHCVFQIITGKKQWMFSNSVNSILSFFHLKNFPIIYSRITLLPKNVFIFHHYWMKILDVNCEIGNFFQFAKCNTIINWTFIFIFFREWGVEEYKRGLQTNIHYHYYYSNGRIIIKKTFSLNWNQY